MLDELSEFADTNFIKSNKWTKTLESHISNKCVERNDERNDDNDKKKLHRHSNGSC